MKRLSDHALLTRVRQLAQDERAATVALISHLAELDRRRLHLVQGYGSLFTYCTAELRLSEHAAYGRIAAARAARRFPLILQMLEEGSITLTTVCLLSALITEENHRSVLDAARHKSKRQVEELVASLRPLPPVPSVVRRLPTRKPEEQTSGDALLSLGSPTKGTTAQDHGIDEGCTFPLRPQNGARPPEADGATSRRTVIAPLAPERYKIQFTASAEMHAKFRQVQALLRHQIPDGDPAAIFDRALSALLEDLMRQKRAAVRRVRTSDQPPADAVHEGKTTAGEADDRTDTDNRAPRRTRQEDTTPGPGVRASRYIPAAFKREVWQRDGGCCASVGAGGRRCQEGAFLEFHHVLPHSLGGRATAANIQLRCRAHNGHESVVAFGAVYEGLASPFGELGRTRSRPSSLWERGEDPRSQSLVSG